MSEQGIRLSKRMAELGLCSRREADELIEQGQVRVDGQIITQLGSRVLPDQSIEVIARPGKQSEARVTLLQHKTAGTRPHDSLTEANHSQADNSDIPFVPRHLSRLHSFGALDDDASGLVIHTQDSRMAQKLQECEMEFLVNVTAAPDLAVLKQRVQSWQAEGRLKREDKVTRQSDRQLRFVLHAPAPQLIATLCQQAGLQIAGYRCNRIGRMALGDLPAGQWRYLTVLERF